MEGADLNLLVAPEALRAEKSMTGAARCPGLSSLAMSQTLARLRSATDDPVFVSRQPLRDMSRDNRGR